MDASPTSGTPVAAPGSMARRVSAMVGIAVIVALALLLMWCVYLHHERSRALPDEPALVFLSARPA